VVSKVLLGLDGIVNERFNKNKKRWQNKKR